MVVLLPVVDEVPTPPPGVGMLGRGVVPVTLPGRGVVPVPVPVPGWGLVEVAVAAWVLRRRVMMELSSVRASTASGERPGGRWVVIVVVVVVVVVDVVGWINWLMGGGGTRLERAMGV